MISNDNKVYLMYDVSFKIMWLNIIVIKDHILHK